MANNPLTDSQFLSWLLVMGFLTETPYPKAGDLILNFHEGAFSYYGILTKEGLETAPPGKLHFFFETSEADISRFHRRYVVSTR